MDWNVIIVVVPVVVVVGRSRAGSCCGTRGESIGSIRRIIVCRRSTVMTRQRVVAAVVSQRNVYPPPRQHHEYKRNEYDSCHVGCGSMVDRLKKLIHLDDVIILVLILVQHTRMIWLMILESNRRYKRNVNPHLILLIRRHIGSN